MDISSSPLFRVYELVLKLFKSELVIREYLDAVIFLK